ncbi:hypothetical protein Syun_009367 [Stephania yunnanensis]|uniref:Small auxin up regulated protein n=1 Tax=Stephania yunnanensis TaxID=152371 RepID=A0AAP0PNG7_9MAGN
MKKINLIVKKCKSLSRQLRRSSSYTSLSRSKSTREEDIWGDAMEDGSEQREIILVGSTRRRYVIRAKYLSHPLLNALIDNSNESAGGLISIKCEVVLLDHLLWMLENAGPTLSSESLEELTQLYAF